MVNQVLPIKESDVGKQPPLHLVIKQLHYFSACHPAGEYFDLVKDVGTALGMDIDKKDISAAHRVPTFRKDGHPALTVQFVSRLARDNIIGKFREKKKMAAQDVNASFPKDSMYVNEHLSPGK
ncbi:hypothetical protein J6590_074987 [Homalodisca vitripennis]|nr:hypothetical protein J6590_074987 [Homalodisca vitripennis]